MANKKLGLYLAPDNLKLVEIEQKGNDFSLLDWAVATYPFKDSPEARAKALSAVLKEHKIRTRETNLAAVGLETVYKLIELPLMPDKDIASALKYKLEKLLPYPVKDAVIDYYPLRSIKREGKTLFFVAVIPMSKILQLSEIIKKSGLLLKTIISPSSTLTNLLKQAGPGTQAFIHLCAQVSLIIIAKDGQVVFAREVQAGGDDIAKAMVGMVQTEQGRLELDYEKAQKLINTFGIPIDMEEYSKQAEVPAEEVLALMRPALEKIANEIMDTFEYYRKEVGDQGEFSRIYLTGSTAQTKNLLVYFKDQLGIPFEGLLVEISSQRSDFLAAAPVLAIALGAALPGKDTLNLLPAEQSQLMFSGFLSGRSQWLNPRFFALGFVFFFCLIFAWFSVKAGNIDSSYKILEKQNAVLQRQYDDLAAASASRQRGGEITYAKGDRFIKGLNELNRITPGDVYLESMAYDNKTGGLVMKGIALGSKKLTSVPLFVERLNKNRYFKSVLSSSLKESELYTTPVYTFEIKCVLAEEP